MTITTVSLLTKIMMIMLAYTVFLSIIIMIGGSNLFIKASKGDKSANKPILNLFVMLDVAEMSSFYGILFFLPVANVIVLSIMSYKIGKLFNAGVGYQIGLVLLPFVFYPMLSFSDMHYKVTDEEYFKLMDNAKDLSVNLMTQDEINEMNKNVVVEDVKVDSIYKTPIQVMEEVETYKAGRIDILTSGNDEVVEEVSLGDFAPIEKVDVINNTLLNNESGVDSIFKTEVQMMEKVEPYKAGNINILDEKKDEVIEEVILSEPNKYEDNLEVVDL